MERLRVLELYSGIGGMHYALEESGVPFQVVAAIDINTTANKIYSHNFPNTPVWNKNIEGITVDDLNKLSCDLLLMSPPCQPFTRLGLKGDVSDARTKSFLYILDLLPRMNKLPNFVLVENVKGFETSSARENLVKTLTNCGYSFQEIMISPTSVGIPNSRLRYFLVAKFSTLKVLDAFPYSPESYSPKKPAVLSPLLLSNCQPEEELQDGHVFCKVETTMDEQKKLKQNSDLSLRQIQDFLEPHVDVNMERYLLPPKTLLRYALLLDIVCPTYRRSNCFTKGYGRYVEGTGSVLQCSTETETSLSKYLRSSGTKFWETASTLRWWPNSSACWFLWISDAPTLESNSLLWNLTQYTLPKGQYSKCGLLLWLFSTVNVVISSRRI
ncbi:tRNA (cytosine(38)-C(5))-methyltransferase isoform X2 [Brachionichthys hirsutus]|uniref:tRNA (cytosine(38)-C(5))-methyltransferase isoform X2 n=1 Tax=Brachionichthys hirsutus TaxID=412623 RepID=UPI00360483C2